MTAVNTASLGELLVASPKLQLVKVSKKLRSGTCDYFDILNLSDPLEFIASDWIRYDVPKFVPTHVVVRNSEDTVTPEEAWRLIRHMPGFLVCNEWSNRENYSSYSELESLMRSKRWSNQDYIIQRNVPGSEIKVFYQILPNKHTCLKSEQSIANAIDFCKNNFRYEYSIMDEVAKRISWYDQSGTLIFKLKVEDVGKAWLLECNVAV